MNDGNNGNTPNNGDDKNASEPSAALLSGTASDLSHHAKSSDGTSGTSGSAISPIFQGSSSLAYIPGIDGSGGSGTPGYSSRDKLLSTLEQLLALEALDLDTTLNRANTLVAEALDCEKSDTFLYDPSINSLVAHGTSNTPMGVQQRQLGLGTLPLVNGGRAAQVFLTGVPFASGHQDQDPEELPGIKEALGVRSVINVPLEVDGQRRGVVQVDSSQPDKFTQEDVHFLQAVSRWLGMVTHRAELVQQITQETAQQASRATAEELIEVLAHDMNNYLTPLGGWIGVLRQRAHQEENELYIGPADAAYKSLTRLKKLVKDLLDIRRLQYGLFTLSRQPVDLIELVHEATMPLQTSKLRLLLQVETEDELRMHADPQRLQQLLENLISNALKYSPAEVPVNVTVAKEIRMDREWATITIRDEGPGISEEQMPTLFNRYSAGPESTGLGLGLYLGKNIAEAHGGTLTADSTLGQGTSFCLSLPL